MVISRQKTWIEISGEALRANLRQASLAAHGAQIAPVIKANAYGHGLEEVCRALEGESFPFLCVDSVEELMRVRSVNTHVPVLVMGYVPRHQMPEVKRLRAACVISKVEQLEVLRDIQPSTPMPIHLEVETGLHRQGADLDQEQKILAWVKAHPTHASIEGICTHLANAEDTTSSAFVEEQTARFSEAVFRLAKEGIVPRYRHVACSAALWLHTQTLFDVVRFGISLYGYWSSAEVAQVMHADAPTVRLQSALSWKTLLAEIKMVKKGETVGYDRTFTAERDLRMGVLPIGYADGFDRRLSGVGAVCIRGKLAPVIGRVCMNMCMVDLTNIPEAMLEEEVVIFGAQEACGMSPEQWEERDPTFLHYEILARLRADIPRVLVS